MNASGEDVLSALSIRRGGRVRALLLVAHPDDEVLGASVALRAFDRLRVAYGTDGSGGRPEVTAARFAELEIALERLGVAPALSACGFPDGRLVEHAAALARRLDALLPGTDVLVTHAFEGGHPDHDACALAAQIACARAGRAVARLEFAIYARSGGGMLFNGFPASERAVALALSPEEQAGKRHALDAFASQRHVVDRFPLRRETFRVAPVHDFTRPRDPDDLLFAFAKSAREAAWREAARRALDG